MQSKNKIQTRPIEDFIGQVRTAKNGQQKQIVLPIKDAERLADSLAQTMTRLAGIQEEIIEALKIAQQSQTLNIEMDGGLNRHYLNITGTETDKSLPDDYEPAIQKWLEKSLELPVQNYSEKFVDDGKYFTWVIPDQKFYIEK
jgi:hypothetical protein